MSNECPKIVKCPLFNDKILKRAESAEVYKKLFCRNSEKFKECKRYQVSEKIGTCADFVMPNSTLTVDEIIQKMKEKALIP
ncbi:MAG: hypothetical protein R6X09_11260 [Bacteroidales bacterium]